MLGHRISSFIMICHCWQRNKHIFRYDQCELDNSFIRAIEMVTRNLILSSRCSCCTNTGESSGIFDSEYNHVRSIHGTKSLGNDANFRVQLLLESILVRLTITSMLNATSYSKIFITLPISLENSSRLHRSTLPNSNRTAMDNENNSMKIAEVQMVTLRWWAFYALLSLGLHVDEEQIEEKAYEMWNGIWRQRGLDSSRRK
jgi:hypothetical protein